MNGSLSTNFGFEISQYDLDHLSNTALVKLLLDHKLLLIRSLSLTPQQLIDYGRKFGKLYLSSSDLKGNGEARHMKSEQHPEITVLKRTGLHGDFLVEWHIDLIHKASDILPGRILYAHQAEAASTTLWSDTEKAYQLIPSPIRTQIEQSVAFYAAPYWTPWIGAVREIVYDNPLTHRRSLLLDQTFTHCVIGKTYEDTDALKAEVFNQTLIADNIYTHQWQQDDLIIYDNNTTMHQREVIAEDAKGERTIWRLTFDFR